MRVTLVARPGCEYSLSGRHSFAARTNAGSMPGGGCRGRGERLACHWMTGQEGMDRLDAMKVFVVAVDEGSLAGRGAQARPLAGGGQPRHRLPGGAGRRRAAAPDDAVDQAERGGRALCGDLPPRAHRAGGGRRRRGRTARGAARPAHDHGAGGLGRDGAAADPRCLSRRLSDGVGEALAVRPRGQPDRGGRRHRASHRPSRRLRRWWRCGSARSAASWWLRRAISSSTRASTEPGDLAKHQIMAMAHLPNSWTFAPPAGSSVPRTVQFTPRLVVNSTYAAVASAVAGRGVARMYSYQVAEQVRARRARDRAGRRRGSGDAGASDLPAGPARGAEGARLHRLRRAPAEEALCAAARRASVHADIEAARRLPMRCFAYSAAGLNRRSCPERLTPD